MNDAMLPHKRKRVKHLACEPTNQRSRKPNKAIRLDELIQVDTQEFHGNAQVTTEVEVFRHLDNMMLLIVVLGGRKKRGGGNQTKHNEAKQQQLEQELGAYPFSETVQNLDFHEGLVVEPLLIADDLYGNRLSRTMIPAM